MDAGGETYLPADWVRQAARATDADALLQQFPMHARTQVLPPWPLSFEWHAGFEVGVLLAGEQRRFHPGSTQVLGPGDIWLTPAWEPHGWTIPTGERSVAISFLPEFLGEETLGDLTWLSLFAVPAADRPRVTAELRPQVVAIGEELFAEVAEARPKWHVAVRLNLLRLFLTVSRDWQPPAEVLRRGSARDSRLLRLMPALTLLQEGGPTRVSAATAAAACGMSLSRFCVVFKSTMGVSFGQFCLRTRAAAAAHLLRWTELGVHQIAPQAGFADASHLHHTFMSLYGCSPGAYRRQLRASPGGALFYPPPGVPADRTRVHVRVAAAPPA